MWYVGQKIVAIRNHSQGVFKKGDKFIINGIKRDCCTNHLLLNIDTGIRRDTECKYCLKTDVGTWYYDNLFAPIEEVGNVTIEQILEEMSVEEPKTCQHA